MKEFLLLLAVLAGITIFWAGAQTFGPARVFQRTAKALSR